MLCQSFWILFPLFILTTILNKTARSPYILNHNSQVYFPWDPLFTLPLQSCFQGSRAIGVGWWHGTFSLSSGASSSRISCRIISCSAGWRWSWPFQSWKLSFYVIHVRKKHRFTPSSVPSPSSQISQTQNLFPEADFHAGQTKHQKHLFQPPTSQS